EGGRGDGGEPRGVGAGRGADAVRRDRAQPVHRLRQGSRDRQEGRGLGPLAAGGRPRGGSRGGDPRRGARLSSDGKAIQFIGNDPSVEAQTYPFRPTRVASVWATMSLSAAKKGVRLRWLGRCGVLPEFSSSWLRLPSAAARARSSAVSPTTTPTWAASSRRRSTTARPASSAARAS